MRLGPRTRIAAMALTVIAAGGLGAGVAGALGGGHAAAPTGLGALPAYLPTSSVRPDSTLVGTAAHPALTSEGDAVRARLPHGSVLVRVTGPEVPGEGLPFQTTADTATWRVTLSHATCRIPISVANFSTIDSRGKVYSLAFVPGAKPPPKVLRPGGSTHFELRAVMAVGEGMLRWAPVHNDLLATWDFEVEND
jgi:hypothetical protein